ncbi:magnesium transporter [Desulfonatronum parangueonense]
MSRDEMLNTINQLLVEDREQEAREYCAMLHPEDLAGLLTSLSRDEQLRIFAMVGPKTSAEVFCRLQHDDQQEIAVLLPDAQLARIISHMPADDRVDLFKTLPPERGETLLGMMARTEREDIRNLSSHAEGTAGSVMTSDYASLSANISVRQALDRLRREAPDKETIYSVYVLDDQRRLVGTVSLRKLIIARPETRVGDVMLFDPPFVRVDDDQEVVAAKLHEYDLLAIPVLDTEDAMAGIITFDDVHDIMVQEVTEDFHRMGGVSHQEPPGISTLNMRDVSFWLMVRKRLPWLLVLVFMNIFSGAGIAYFEDTIAAVVALVFFLPLLIDCGGNAGSQASTLMIRALATGRAQLGDWFHLLGREVLVAAVLGICLGVAVSFIGIFRAGPEVAFVVALTMVCTVLFGSLVGMSLPFLLNRLKMDPATASAPLVTSIADVGGVLIYFSIATYLLRDIIAAAG